MKQVGQLLNESDLIEREDKVCVAFSGGADSTCLLHLLNRLRETLGFSLSACHVNHQLRGAESDRDELQVRDFCRQLGIDLTVVRRDVQALAKQQKLSLELAARQVRYAFFLEEVTAGRATKIALAHHQQDQAETVLLHLLRGTSLNGLQAMSAQRGVYIRPLLTVDKGLIDQYMVEQELPFCQDGSNLDNHFTRNRLRNQCLPYLKEQFNPQIVASLARLAMDVREANQLLEPITMASYQQVVWEQTDNQVILLIDELKQLSAYVARQVIRQAIVHLRGEATDVTAHHLTQIYQLLTKPTGKRQILFQEIDVRRSYNQLLLCKPVKEAETVESQIDLPIALDRLPTKGYIYGIERYYLAELVPLKHKDFIKNNMNVYAQVFDYDRIEQSPIFRHRLPGDYLRLDSQGHRKKLKDELIDRKIPQAERDKLWLLVDGQSIMWIVGHRTSAYYHITETTRKALKIEMDVKEIFHAED